MGYTGTGQEPLDRIMKQPQQVDLLGLLRKPDGVQSDANTASDAGAELSPTGETLGTYAVGSYPDSIAFDGTNMWVVNTGSDYVTELSPTGATLGMYAVGSHPSNIAFDGTHMWVSNVGENSVTKL